MFANYNRPRAVAWFFFILAFGFTFAAGTWQVNRLQWKQGLIAELAAAQKEAPRSGLPKDTAELAALQFRPVTVRGTWLGDTEFHITPRYIHDQFGYALITPLKLTDGRILLINRGWIPGKKKLLEMRPETHVRGNVVLSGLVRVGAERNYFTPANQPEKNIWFGRDIADMAAYAKLENVVPAMVDVVAPEALAKEKPVAQKTAETKQAELKLPVPSDGIIRLRNDHLSYIVTWYGIALGILVIFLVYHRKKKQ